MSRIGAAPRAAVSVSNARAEASRRNGARSRGPKTPEGKARSALNALKHGMRAAKHVVLPQEDAVAFNQLQALLFEELAPEGALQLVLARRVAVAAWRLARADRLEVEVLEFRSYEGAGLGIALMRDGNGTRSVETLLRYRNAAMAEFGRALKTLKALKAEQARQTEQAAGAMDSRASTPAAQVAHRPQPIEPERAPARRIDHVMSDPPAAGGTLHEHAAPWMPNEPEPASRTTSGSTRNRTIAPPATPSHGNARRRLGDAPRRRPQLDDGDASDRSAPGPDVSDFG